MIVESGISEYDADARLNLSGKLVFAPELLAVFYRVPGESQHTAPQPQRFSGQHGVGGGYVGIGRIGG